MYGVDLDIPVGLLGRDLAQDYPGKMAEYVAEVVLPAVERRVDEMIAPYPPPAIHPFAFATGKSKAFYHWIADKGLVPTDGENYIRTNEVHDSWRVHLDRRLSEGQLTITNTASDNVPRNLGQTLSSGSAYAGWLFNPERETSTFQQVPGHVETGWGADFETTFDLIAEETADLLLDGWYEIVTGER